MTEKQLDPSNTEDGNELNVNSLEIIVADHNKAMRTDMASEITGGTRSKAITDVITVKAIINWHKKQLSNYILKSESDKMVDKAKIDELRDVMRNAKLDLNQSASINHSTWEMNIRHHIDQINQAKEK